MGKKRVESFAVYLTQSLKESLLELEIGKLCPHQKQTLVKYLEIKREGLDLEAKASEGQRRALGSRFF